MIIDHIGLIVSDLERSKRFYNQVLRPLGINKLIEIEGAAVGYGKEGKPEFWISCDKKLLQPTHAAFRAQNMMEVQAFHTVAINAGGKDNGEPGIRPHYHANYFAAYITDPDGHNIEAVCHSTQTEDLTT